jgi:hypothetical protein
MRWTFLMLWGGFLNGLGLSKWDREIIAGAERLPEISVFFTKLDDDPNLKRISERSPYVRNER